MSSVQLCSRGVTLSSYGLGASVKLKTIRSTMPLSALTLDGPQRLF